MACECRHEKAEIALHPALAEPYAVSVLEDRSEAIVCIRFIRMTMPLMSKPVLDYICQFSA